MGAPEIAPDRVVELLAAEDSRTRHLARRLTVLPIASGVVVIAAARWSVTAAHRRLDELEAHRQELAGEIEALEAQRADLAEDLDRLKRVSVELRQRLPVGDRERAADLERGLDQARQGNFSQAVSFYRRVTAGNPNDSVALGLEGAAQLKANDVEVAVETLRRAVRADPRNAAARYDLALALAAGGRLDDAVRESDDAFRLDPSLELRAASDRAFLPVRRAREARQGAASAASERERAHVSAGLSAAHAGQLDAAVKEYEAALALNPGNVEVLNWRGYALYRLGRLADAAVSLQRALQLRPALGEAHYNLSKVLWAQGRHPDAAAELERAIALDRRLQGAARSDPDIRPVARALEERRPVQRTAGR